jgi:hypothetical protein
MSRDPNSAAQIAAHLDDARFDADFRTQPLAEAARLFFEVRARFPEATTQDIDHALAVWISITNARHAENLAIMARLEAGDASLVSAEVLADAERLRRSQDD